MTLRSHKYAILLTATIGVALVESFTHRLLLRPVASDLAVLTTEMLVLLIVFDRRVNRLVGVIAFATAGASVLAHYTLPPTYPQLALQLIYHSALLLLLGYATIVILRNIFQEHVVRSDDVLGAVCGYLLASGAWANLFALIEIFVPGSYRVGEGFGTGFDSWHGRTAMLNYVSLGSLTGVGSGAVVPVRPPATVLTTLEAVFGQFYIAIVVAQLVGARLSHAPPRDSSPHHDNV